MSEFEIPRCSHGSIILGCPHDDCPEQTAFLAEQSLRLDEFYARQRDEARAAVRAALGLPVDSRPAVLTREVLEAAIKKVQDRQFIAHGSPEDPHIVHPNGGICFGCGQFFESPLRTGSGTA
jgi:hypothetical protein